MKPPYSLTTPPTNPNIVAIQILRGLAAWAVVFHHFMQIFFSFQSSNYIGMVFAEYGQLGIDIFFVISGFIMHQTLLRKRYSASAFTTRRLIRIMPAYWVATFVLIGSVAIGLISPDYQFALWNDETLALSLFWIPHEHLAGIGLYPVLTVGWTLNYEMFFYAVLALCLLITPRYAATSASVIIVLLPIISRPDWLWGSIMNNTLIYEFVIGIFISNFYQKRYFQKKRNKAMPKTAIILITVAMVWILLNWPYYHFIGSFLIVSGALILEASILGAPGNIVKLFAKIGDLSYSTYLYHLIALFVLFKAFGTPQDYLSVAVLLVGTVTMIITMSVISYQLVEQKLGKWLLARLVT